MGFKKTVLIRQIDLWTGKPFGRNKIRGKNAKKSKYVFFVFFSELLQANSQRKPVFSEKA